MLRTDRDALICDMAETYHIFDMFSYRLSTISRLAVGLRSNSRIKTKMAGFAAPIDTVLIAQCLDALNLIVWSKTEDAQKGGTPPDKIAPVFYLNYPREDKDNSDYIGFASPEDFEAARADILLNLKIGGDGNGQNDAW